MREISVAEQRYQAVLAVISDGLSISQVASKVGVSRQTLGGSQVGGPKDSFPIRQCIPSVDVDLPFHRRTRLVSQTSGYRGQTQYLRVYVAALRRKLVPEPSEPRYFITASGLGYRFQNDS
jgi:hypothetical protein